MKSMRNVSSRVLGVVVFVALLVLSLVLSTTTAMAGCLTTDRRYNGPIGFWVNNCSVGVSVRWRNGLAWVAPNAKATANLGNGDFDWMECKSPRPYQYTPYRAPGGEVHCK